MSTRINAIYGRQSIDRPDSISIESQVEFCVAELHGEPYQTYLDKGYSGKNTDRPAFQEMMADIKNGKIQKVIVYKLDRISRSILDFSTMMGQFQNYHVEFVSSTEKFDTSTPMGRAMLNICIVFAQLERETIQKRITDAYYSRSQRGFRMGGKAPYGFHYESTKIGGVNTKMLVANQDEISNVQRMYEMYAKPQTSYGDIVRYFEEHRIQIFGKSLHRSTLSKMLSNPVYVRADLDIYRFFKSQGTEIVNDVMDFTGTNGCYLYKARDVETYKYQDFEGRMLVLAPHAGVISSDLWLTCRKKQRNNDSIQTARKATHTWTAGKIKCGNCGFALMSVTNPSGVDFLRCTKRLDNKSCPGCGKIRTADLESAVLQSMKEQLAKRRVHGRHRNPAHLTPEITKMQLELVQIENEIQKLIDSLTGANSLLISYANNKITELDEKKRTLQQKLADLTATSISPEQYELLVVSLANWDTIDFDDKRNVVDMMIRTISATHDTLNIDWKF